MLRLGLRLGTGNGYFFFFSFLKVTNTFVLPSWAEAWCKCDVILFICDCLHGSLPPTLCHQTFYIHTKWAPLLILKMERKITLDYNGSHPVAFHVCFRNNGSICIECCQNEDMQSDIFYLWWLYLTTHLIQRWKESLHLSQVCWTYQVCWLW